MSDARPSGEAAPRTARAIATYSGGRRVRVLEVSDDSPFDEIVRDELSAHDESAQVVILDERGHRLERWVRRGRAVLLDWSLPGVVLRARRMPSSIPPPLDRRAS